MKPLIDPARHYSSQKGVDPMRAEGTRNAICLKAYAGTTGVMLAMNVTNARRTGLLGFAIEREGPAGEHRWLQGLLRFPGQGGARLS
ncbi:MAG TPA: hypothetical protein VFX82_11365, partial [Desulfobacterales bacterium]|nr:hypothetical protein [Desulfobacterales bacterium]